MSLKSALASVRANGAGLKSVVGCCDQWSEADLGVWGPVGTLEVEVPLPCRPV